MTSTPFPLPVLRSLALGLSLLATFLAAPLSAQDTSVVAPLAVPPAPERVVLDASRLRPQRLVYQMVLLQDTLARPLGERTVSVYAATHNQIAAWVLREGMHGPLVPSTSDSLLVTRATLAPLHWESVLGPSRLSMVFSRDSIYGAVQGPATRRSLILAGAPGLVTSAAAMDAWLQLAPLQPGWTAAVSLLLVDAGGARVVPATVSVDGVESVRVPAGEWECWRVLLRTDGGERRFWVRRFDPLVVRSTQRLPHVAGELESVLFAVEPL